ncbi:MAG: hypothetical protein AAGL98_13525 [Planctomycetota bacterium]
MCDVHHKYHACCHGLHAMLEALRDVRIPSEGTEKIEVYTHPRWLSVCNQPAPESGLGVKFSYRHAAAMALSGYDTGALETFSDDVARNPELVALRERVVVKGQADLSELQARVCIGKSEMFHDLAAPLSHAQRTGRLREKAASLLGRDLEAALWGACGGNDLGGLAACLAQVRGETHVEPV